MSQDKPTGRPEPEAKQPTTAQGEGATAVGPRGVNISGNVGGSIHTGDVIHYYLIGTHTTLFQFTVGIENFLTTYLGSPEKPVPFGGRARELAWLDDWLDHGRQQRLLLVAPAGRGKSALLARWSAQLTKRENLAVVFMPISVRFNTNREDNTFVVLATRLAHFYGKQIPTDYANFTPQMWRGLVAEYLKEPLPDGRRLLLILDSLDEAAWQVAGDLLPLNLPATTRVVVSARYLGGEAQSPQPWLRRLEWSDRAETLELEVLDSAGVRDVLEKMGCPLDELGRNVDIVSELHRLSLGDPLLVELYVQDLWQRGEEAAHLRPEDLHSIQPGYQGYFDRWWQEQKRLWDREKPVQEKLLRGLLTLLSLAHGPLTVADLQELLPASLEADSWLLRETVTHLSRFVIGDGRDQGYVFSHPKLADYFRDQLSLRDQTAWRQHFLAWGERTLEAVNTGQIRPREASSYLMQYYRRHLEEAQASVETLLTLVSQEWMQVWYEKTGSYAGFLQDVEQVWARLQAENATSATNTQEVPYIGQEILCVLCQASVNSLADKIPDELLILLLQEGVWTTEQVIAYMRQRQDPEKRSQGFIQVLPHLPAERQPALWLEALAAARELRDERSRARALVAVAPHVEEMERPAVLAEAMAAVWRISDERSRTEVLVALAPHLLTDVLEVVPGIGDERSRAEVLTALAPYLPTDVLEAARGISNEWSRAEVLVALAPYVEETERRAVLAEAMAAVEQMGDKESLAEVLVILAPYVEEMERPAVLAKAVAIGRRISDEWRRAEVLTALAPHLPTDVLEAARGIGDERNRVEVLVALAPHVEEMERPAVLAEAVAAAEQIYDERSWAEVLAMLAPHLPTDVLAAAGEIGDEWSRAEVLVALAPHVEETEHPAVFAEAVAAVEQIGDYNWWRRAEVLVALAPHLPTNVLEAAREIRNEERRAEVLAALAPHVRGMERPAVLAEAVATVRRISDERSQLEVLAALAPHVGETEHPAVFAEAVAAVEQIGDYNWWSLKRVLVVLAPHLPTDVLEAARKISNEWGRAEVLAALAPFLPTDVLEAARGISNEWSRAEVLVALAPYLTAGVLSAARELQDKGRRSKVLAAVAPYEPDKVLAIAWKIADEEQRTQVLMAVAQYRPGGVLDAVRKIWDEGRYAQVMIALAPHLAEAECFAAWNEALAAARKIWDEERRAQVLALLALHLKEAERSAVWNEALAAARKMWDERHRAQMLAILAPPLKEAERQAVWDEALAAARELPDEGSLAEVLATMAPYRPEVVLAEARELRDERRRVEVLKAVALYRPEVVLTEARELPDEESLAEVLATMAPYRPEAVLAEVRELRDEKRCTKVLAAVAFHLETKYLVVLYRVWHEMLSLLSQRTRPHLLSDLAALMPVIHKLGGDKGVADTLDAVRKVTAWWP